MVVSYCCVIVGHEVPYLLLVSDCYVVVCRWFRYVVWSFVVLVLLCGWLLPRCLRRGCAAAGLLGLRVRISPGGMNVSCGCCVLSGRGLCVGPITRPVESYRVWGVWVRSWSLDIEEALAHWGLLRHGKKKCDCYCWFHTGVWLFVVGFVLLCGCYCRFRAVT